MDSIEQLREMIDWHDPEALEDLDINLEYFESKNGKNEEVTQIRDWVQKRLLELTN